MSRRRRIKRTRSMCRRSRWRRSLLQGGGMNLGRREALGLEEGPGGEVHLLPRPPERCAGHFELVLVFLLSKNLERT